MLLWGGGTVFAVAVLAYLVVTALGSVADGGTEVAGARASGAALEQAGQQAPFVVLRPGDLSDRDTLTRLVGQDVRLENAAVQYVISQAVYWVGFDDSQRLLVVRELTQTGAPSRRIHPLRDGESVTVTGTLILPNGPSDALTRHAWTTEELNALRQAPIVLRAGESQSSPRE